ncbi:MAG: ferritin family protein [Candidatus Cloacimonetes bacterium]|nr:ferritin family protein [Candidatus Cloacimonadota bacterium]MBL7149307.1 ferritin family protein [Candidatus Cloacimonadota bacterium]
MIFFSKNEIIEMAVEIEKNGFAFYDRALQRSDLNNDAKKLLQTLRDEEKVHEKTFLNLREKIDNFDMNSDINWDEAKLYIQSMVDTHLFNQPEKAIQLAASARDLKDLVSNAIQFEKDTLLFFYFIKKFIANEKSKKAIENIVDEEIFHVVKLKKIQDTL